MSSELKDLKWEKMGGLIPAVIQDAASLQVLMLGYMSRESLDRTVESGKVTFFSRSKGRLWTKGETSGHLLEYVSAVPDCDGDAVLVTARPVGPACHRETTSCFGDETAPGVGFLGKLSAVVDGRFRDRPAGSYTTTLFEGGADRMAQKVGEEGVEVAIAAKNPDNEALKGEAADLIFHLMVLLRSRGLSLDDVASLLKTRHAK